MHIEVKEDNEFERPKRHARFPNARKVFMWFPNPQKWWWLSSYELQFAELLYERGEKAVKGALAYVQKHKDDEFFYKVTKPSDLEKKWLDLIEHKP